jgi:hypothetical protein
MQEQDEDELGDLEFFLFFFELACLLSIELESSVLPDLQFLFCRVISLEFDVKVVA